MSAISARPAAAAVELLEPVTKDIDAAKRAMHCVAPVGEKVDCVARAMRNIGRFLEGTLEPT